MNLERPRTTTTRRQLLQLGGIGAIGLGLPELLRASDWRTKTARRGRASSSCSTAGAATSTAST